MIRAAIFVATSKHITVHSWKPVSGNILQATLKHQRQQIVIGVQITNSAVDVFGGWALYKKSLRRTLIRVNIAPNQVSNRPYVWGLDTTSTGYATGILKWVGNTGNQEFRRVNEGTKDHVSENKATTKMSST